MPTGIGGIADGTRDGLLMAPKKNRNGRVAIRLKKKTLERGRNEIQDRPIVLGIIPARKGSQGLPGKNSRHLLGAPLILYTIRAARESRVLTHFLVSTDDPTVARIARRVGAPVPFQRPRRLATSRSPLWPVVEHATAFWEKENRQKVDVVVLLQPTSPLRAGGDIDACVRQLQKGSAEICVTVTRSHDNPYFNIVQVQPGSQRAVRPFSEVMGIITRRQEAPPVYSLNGAVYALRRRLLGRFTNLFDLRRITSSEMPQERSIDIDSEGDFALAEFLMKRGRKTPQALP